MDKLTLEQRQAAMRERPAQQRLAREQKQRKMHPNSLQNMIPGAHPYSAEERQEGKKRRLRSVAETIRVLLTRKGPTGYSDLEHMVFALAQVAKKAGHPRQIDAFDALMDRGWGKAPPSAEELEARGGGAFVVVLQRPELDQAERAPAPKPEPKFLTGEFTEEE